MECHWIDYMWRQSLLLQSNWTEAHLLSEVIHPFAFPNSPTPILFLILAIDLQNLSSYSDGKLGYSRRAVDDNPQYGYWVIISHMHKCIWMCFPNAAHIFRNKCDNFYFCKTPPNGVIIRISPLLWLRISSSSVAPYWCNKWQANAHSRNERRPVLKWNYKLNKDTYFTTYWTLMKQRMDFELSWRCEFVWNFDNVKGN